MAANSEACDWTMSGTTQGHRYYLPIRLLEYIGSTNIGRIISEPGDMEDDCPEDRKLSTVQRIACASCLAQDGKKQASKKLRAAIG